MKLRIDGVEREVETIQFPEGVPNPFELLKDRPHVDREVTDRDKALCAQMSKTWPLSALPKHAGLNLACFIYDNFVIRPRKGADAQADNDD